MKVIEGVAMNWNKQRQIIMKQEISIIVISILLIAFGFFAEWQVAHGIIFLVVRDLSSMSLTLLQIQASITTLTLAIIALLSGTISDSYMGVSICQFFLHKRAQLLKQKYLIITEFVLLFINVWSHLVAKYNIVIAIFTISLILILYAILEIFWVFHGKKNICEEIESYIIYSFKNEKDILVGENFISDWKVHASSQSQEEYEHYRDLTTDFIIKMVLYDKCIDEGNRLIENIIKFFFQNESISCKLKGIMFIDYFYEQLYRNISQHTDITFNLEKPFLLISRVSREFVDALDFIEPEAIENSINLDRFFDKTLIVSSLLAHEDKNGEISSLYSLAIYLGTYITKQKQKGKLIDSSYWERICLCKKYFLGMKNISKAKEKSIKQSVIMYKFNACYGFILNGQISFVKNAIFLDSIRNIYRIDDKDLVLLPMLVHCYMFYLAYRESKDCIDEELQGHIKNALLDTGVINSITHFYFKLSNNVGILEDNIGDEIEDILQHYDTLFPKHGNGKTVTMSTAVQDYFLYVSLLLDMYSTHRQGLNLLNIRKYYFYLRDSDNHRLRSCIENMHPLFFSESNSHNNTRTDSMLFSFSQKMTERYKTHFLNEAKITQQKYDNEKVQEEAIIQINDTIREEFNYIFNSLNAPCENMKTYNKEKTIKITTCTEFINEQNNINLARHVAGDFTSWIICELASILKIKIQEQNEVFNDYDSFKAFLDQYSLLLGAKNVFDYPNYFSRYSTYSSFLKNKDCRFAEESSIGIAFNNNDLFVLPKDISVKIYQPTPEEMGFKSENEKGLYSYKTKEGIQLNFEKEELDNLIPNEHKIIEISVNVTLGANINEIYPAIITDKK